MVAWTRVAARDMEESRETLIIFWRQSQLSLFIVRRGKEKKESRKVPRFLP